MDGPWGWGAEEGGEGNRVDQPDSKTSTAPNTHSMHIPYTLPTPTATPPSPQ